MELLIIAMVLGIIPALIAQSKGRSFGGWWVYGTLLFIVALIHSLVMSSEKTEFVQAAQPVATKPANTGKKECPFCAEYIQVEAKICRYCGKDQEPAAAKTIAPKPPSRNKNDYPFMFQYGRTTIHHDNKHYVVFGKVFDTMGEAKAYVDTSR